MTPPEKPPSAEKNDNTFVNPWRWIALGSGSTVLLFLSGVGVWTLISPVLTNVKAAVENQLTLSAQELHGDLSSISIEKVLGDSSVNSRKTYLGNRTMLVTDKYPKNEAEATSKIPSKAPTENVAPSRTEIPSRAETPNSNNYVNPELSNSPKGAVTNTTSNEQDKEIKPENSSSIDKPSESTSTSSSGSFHWAWNFSEGLAEVKVGEQWGYIDRMGRMIVRPQFQGAKYFTEGLASVKIGERWGYIDRTGKIIISPRFQEAGGFSSGFAPVKFDDKWGYIDNTGNFVVQPQYEAAENFYEGLANVKVGDRWGYIEPTGRMVISPQFTDTWGFSQGIAQVKLGNRIAYVDKDGKFISSRP